MAGFFAVLPQIRDGPARLRVKRSLIAGRSENQRKLVTHASFPGFGAPPKKDPVPALKAGTRGSPLLEGYVDWPMSRLSRQRNGLGQNGLAQPFLLAADLVADQAGADQHHGPFFGFRHGGDGELTA